MSRHLVLIPADEAAWEASSPDEKKVVFAAHTAFQERLTELGCTLVAAGELAPSRAARVVRSTGSDSVSVSEGPFAESTEQISGFYLVEAPDVDVVCEALAVLAPAESHIEVRPLADGADHT